MAPERLCAPSSRSNGAASTSPSDAPLLFITANNPKDFKKQKVMKKVRTAAMMDHLRKKEKLVAGGHGLRVPRQPRSRVHSEDSNASRGTESDDDVEELMSSEAALRIFRGNSRREASPVASVASYEGTSAALAVQDPFPTQRRARLAMSLPESLAPWQNSRPLIEVAQVNPLLPYDTYKVDLQHLEAEINPFVSVSRSQTASLAGFALEPERSLGKSLDPFKTMPQVSHPRVSVEQLKWHCSRFFGTKAMGQSWIPTLTRSRHAFLSTLCIASSHLDATQYRTTESIETGALRLEVIRLVNRSLLDPNTRIDDFTIIAVIQLICSEIIAGENAMLAFHEAGIETMVQQRGGLECLGVNGNLAHILMSMTFQSAVFRETQPSTLYLRYGGSLSYPNTTSGRKIPESPVFCPRTDFETLEVNGLCRPYTLALLRDVRDMTDLFLDTASSLTTTKGREKEERLKEYLKKIIALPGANELREANPTSGDMIYESIRIASLIQATAIVKRIKLSSAVKAAEDLLKKSRGQRASLGSKRHSGSISPFTISASTTTTAITAATAGYTPASAAAFAYPYARTDSAFPLPSPSTPSVYPAASTPWPHLVSSAEPHFPQPSLIRALHQALIRTPHQTVWSDMTGVLFWVALVGGAAARPQTGGPGTFRVSVPESDEEKTTRKWITALAVRCSVMLAFEHGGAVVGGLGRLLRVTERCGGVGNAAGNMAKSGVPPPVYRRAGEGDGTKETKADKDEARGKRRRVDEGVAGIATGW